MLNPDFKLLKKHLDSLKRKLEIFSDFSGKLEISHRKSLKDLSEFMKEFEKISDDRHISTELKFRLQENSRFFKIASKWSGIFMLKLMSVQMCQEKVKYEGALRQYYNKNGNCKSGWKSLKLAEKYVETEENEFIRSEKEFLEEYSLPCEKTPKENFSLGSAKTEKKTARRAVIPEPSSRNLISGSRRSARSHSSTVRL